MARKWPEMWSQAILTTASCLVPYQAGIVRLNSWLFLRHVLSGIINQIFTLPIMIIYKLYQARSQEGLNPAFFSSLAAYVRRKYGQKLFFRSRPSWLYPELHIPMLMLI
jgi:hypothetical protein